MRNNSADYTQVAVSANTKQTALNVAQNTDTALLVPKSFITALDARRETNEDQATGKEEPDTFYDKGYTAGASMPFTMAQAQQMAFLLAYHYCDRTTTVWGTGFEHLIVPTAKLQPPDVACFTLVERIGLELFKRRHADLFVDTLKVKWEMDKWLHAEGGIKGSGKFDENILQITVNAPYNSAALTLAVGATNYTVQGATAADRLNNIDYVRVKVPATGEWVDVVVTAASGVTPGVLTIVAPGVAVTATDYEIGFIPSEPAWCTIPARVDEPPLLVANMNCRVGGLWNGATFLGGHSLGRQFRSIEHSSENMMEIQPRPDEGFSGQYANHAQRMGRKQTLSIDKDMEDYLMQMRLRKNDYLGIRLKALGPEFETGKNYYVEAIYPRVGVEKVPVKINGKIVGETVELRVMKSDLYPSGIWRVGHKTATYAA